MHYITGSEDLPTPIYTIPDTKERWQQQTCEGTAEAKVILEFVVLGPWLSEIHPLVLSLLVGWHPEVSCHLLLLWHGHWHAPLSWIRDKSFPKYMDDSCYVTGVWLQQYMHHRCCEPPTVHALWVLGYRSEPPTVHSSWTLGLPWLPMHREYWITGLSVTQYIHSYFLVKGMSPQVHAPWLLV